MTDTKVPVSRRAALQRINRLIAPHEKVCVRRGRVPEYDHLDLLNNALLRSFKNLGKEARVFGVLKPYERVVE